MTASGVLQIVLYVVVLLALAKPLGAYMARVYEGRSVGLDRVLGSLERLIYRLCGVRPDEEMGWKTYALAMLLFNVVGLLVVYAAPALPGRAAAATRRARRRDARLVVQHRRQLRHQHQLAGLRRRDDDELPDPDAGADGPELRLGGHRHGDAGGVHPRLRAPHGRDDRQLLGRPDPDDALHPAAALARARARPGLAGRGADLRRVREGAVVQPPVDVPRRTDGKPVSTKGQPKMRGTRAAGPGRRARRPRRSPSSSWAPTAAASSTPTPPTRSRTRRRSRTSSSCCRSC